MPPGAAGRAVCPALPSPAASWAAAASWAPLRPAGRPCWCSRESRAGPELCTTSTAGQERRPSAISIPIPHAASPHPQQEPGPAAMFPGAPGAHRAVPPRCDPAAGPGAAPRPSPVDRQGFTFESARTPIAHFLLPQHRAARGDTGRDSSACSLPSTAELGFLCCPRSTVLGLQQTAAVPVSAPAAAIAKQESPDAAGSSRKASPYEMYCFCAGGTAATCGWC